MLHSLNDHPHAHFKWMLFKDYYDWMIKTLEFAKQNPQFNWIFKQHPTIKFYLTDDVSYAKVFGGLPNHIVYLSEDEGLNTETLIYCADLVSTCVGSPGFELPAMGGIPALIASDTFYNNLGFTIEPKTKEEYFNCLKNTDKIEKLSSKQQKRAQAAFMHIHVFCRVNVAGCPILTIEQIKDRKTNTWYWGEVAKLLVERNNTFKKEIDKYSEILAKPDFKRFNSLEDYIKEKGF